MTNGKSLRFRIHMWIEVKWVFIYIFYFTPRYCPQCKQHREASKRIQIWRLPPILIVHLKRYPLTSYCTNYYINTTDQPTTHWPLTNHLLTTYRPPTDHLLTTYWPLTDHLPTIYQPLTDHPPTTYQPPTDHLSTTNRPPTDHLPTTYWPPTNHLPTTYWPPTTYRPSTNHLPTTYRPSTDHLPTTFLQCSLFTITINIFWFSLATWKEIWISYKEYLVIKDL